MVHVEKHFFTVPEKKGNGKSILLEGQVFEPTHPAGTIVFTEGVGKNRDLGYYQKGSLNYYGPFLERLAEVFTVITFNHRGRGLSEGILTPNGGLDLEGIIASPEVSSKGKKVALVGHSVGAAFSLQAAYSIPERVSSAYLINPYLGPEFHRIAGSIPSFAVPATIAALRLGTGAYFAFATGLYKAFEAAFGPGQDGNAILRKIKVRRRLAEASIVATWTSVPKGGYTVPVAFALADEDEFIGTLNNAERYGTLVSKVRRTVPAARDFSHILAGFNHYLNSGLRNYGEFFAQVSDEKIIDSIVSFSKINMKA